MIGASQGTGALVVSAALGKGHEVSAFSRNPQKLALEHARLTKIAGDFHDAASVEGAVKGHDAVVVTASPTLRGIHQNPTYFTRGTRPVIDAMKRAGVKRLVVLSALGVGESRSLRNFFARHVVMGLVLKPSFEDHDRQEAMVRDSDLDWVIARPGRLTSGPAQRRYLKTSAVEPVPGSISRADLAEFLLEACEKPDWVRKSVHLGG